MKQLTKGNKITEDNKPLHEDVDSTCGQLQ